MDTTRQKRKQKPKTSTIKVHGIRIRESRGKFIIQIRRQGINHYEQFDSLKAAELKAVQLHNEKTQHGLAAFEVDPRTRAQANEAVKILAGRIGLVEAAKFWAVHHPDGSATTMNELATLYTSDLERRKCRPRTLSNIKHRLGRINVDYGNSPACTITTNNLLEWLEVRGGGPTNQDNFRRAFRAVFNFARKRNIVTINPVEAIEAIRADDKAPAIWTAAQVETILRAAQQFAPSMVPMIAVSAFAGLRPIEAARMDWQQVSLTDKSIRILPATSKTRRGRLVEMADNLPSWLAPYHAKTGHIAPAAVTIGRWRIRLAAVLVLGIDEVRQNLEQQAGKKGTTIKAEGLGWRSIVAKARKQGDASWPQDVLRHSYATHWLPIHHDKAKLAENMGNSPDVIESHYKALVSKKDAEAYWKIRPTKAGKIIKMKAA